MRVCGSSWPDASEMRAGSYISQGGNGILVRGIQSSDPNIKAFERKRLDGLKTVARAS